MLSTPLICCSSGVATACSRVCASAPTYVARIWISGGTMFGNWEMGKRAIDTVPTITVSIAITMATIGRLIKKFDTVVSFVFERSVTHQGVISGVRVLGARACQEQPFEPRQRLRAPPLSVHRG